MSDVQNEGKINTVRKKCRRVNLFKNTQNDVIQISALFVNLLNSFVEFTK